MVLVRDRKCHLLGWSRETYSCNLFDVMNVMGFRMNGNTFLGYLYFNVIDPKTNGLNDLWYYVMSVG